MEINFLQCHSGNYSKGRTQGIKYIVVHYTANTKDTAKENCLYFQNNITKTSAHYFVDETSFWQSVKDEDTAFSVGGAKKYYGDCRNSNSISVEMCNSLNSVPEKVKENTKQLVEYLMEKYNVDADHVLRHYDVTHKTCPAPWVKNVTLWNNFKAELQEDMEMTQEKFEEMLQVALTNLGKKEVSSWAKDEGGIEKAKQFGVSDGTRPKALITREETMAMIVRSLEK